MNDERYWNINLLNKWFAISSIIFMVSFIWMFIDDNDDAFKKYQRAFREMEIQTVEKKLLAEIERVKDERVSYEKIFLEAENNFDLKKTELEGCILDLDTAKAKFYKANLNYLGYKSIVDAKKYKYETAKLENNEEIPLEIEKTYFNLIKELEKLKLIKEEKELAVLQVENKIMNL